MSWPARLTPWLRKMFFEKHGGEGGLNDGKLSKLELRQMVHGSADTVVNIWEFNEDTPKINVEGLSSEICELAQADCEESHDGPTAYTLLAFFGGSEFPVARCPAARFISHTRSQGEFDETEPPTGKGILAQQMRHNEALFRMMMINGESERQHSRRLIEMQTNRIQHLEEKNYETNLVLEEMQSKKLEREVYAEREKDKSMRMAEAWEALKAAFPALVNIMSKGKFQLPGGDSIQTMAIDNLLMSITEKQMQQIMTTFSPNQLIGFTELFSAARERREKADLALKEKREGKKEDPKQVTAGDGSAPPKELPAAQKDQKTEPAAQAKGGPNGAS